MYNNKKINYNIIMHKTTYWHKVKIGFKWNDKSPLMYIKRAFSELFSSIVMCFGGIVYLALSLVKFLLSPVQWFFEPFIYAFLKRKDESLWVHFNDVIKSKKEKK